MSERKVQTLKITAVGLLDTVPDVAGLIQACVKLHSENGREVGDLYFSDLHVTYSYAEKTVSHRGGKKRKEVEE